MRVTIFSMCTHSDCRFFVELFVFSDGRWMHRGSDLQALTLAASQVIFYQHAHTYICIAYTHICISYAHAYGQRGRWWTRRMKCIHISSYISSNAHWSCRKSGWRGMVIYFGWRWASGAGIFKNRYSLRKQYLYHPSPSSPPPTLQT